jgi:hypothetical protein
VTFAYVIAANKSIWACADRRLYAGNAPIAGLSTKVVVIQEPDGRALLVYAGLGRVGDTHVSQWVARTIRGINAPLEKVLGVLSAAADRRLIHHARVLGGHFFLASAFEHRQSCLFAISFNPQKGRFDYIRLTRRGRSAAVAMSGTGAQVASRFERRRFYWLRRLVRRYERGQVSAEFVGSGFAAMNRAVAQRMVAAHDRAVSPECIVAYQPTEGGGNGWYFDAVGNLAPGQALPTIVNGFPLSDVANALMERARKIIEGMPVGLDPEERMRRFTHELGAIAAEEDSHAESPDDRLP